MSTWADAEVLFKRADPDNDGTIDAKELNSAAGHALLRLLKRDADNPTLTTGGLSPSDSCSCPVSTGRGNGEGRFTW